MPLKSDFDRGAYRKVLAHALAGAVLGIVPGALSAASSHDHVDQNGFALMLVQLGGILGALTGGLAASAGCIVAAIKHRGTGPGKTDKIKQYQNPEPLPQVPGPTKRPEKVKQPEPTRPEQPPPPTIPPVPPAPAMPPPPSQEAVFQDYDRPSDNS